MCSLCMFFPFYGFMVPDGLIRQTNEWI